MTEVLRAGSETSVGKGFYRIPYNAFRRNVFTPIGEVITGRRLTPQRYSFGEQVTRSNFAAMIVDSFAKSRGQLPVQQGYLEYLRIHGGFDYEATIGDFLVAGGYDCLNTHEKALLSAAFDRVKLHQESPKVNQSAWPFSRRINTELELQIRDVGRIPRPQSFIKPEKLDNLSQAQFIEAVNLYFGAKEDVSSK